METRQRRANITCKVTWPLIQWAMCSCRCKAWSVHVLCSISRTLTLTGAALRSANISYIWFFVGEIFNSTVLSFHLKHKKITFASNNVQCNCCHLLLQVLFNSTQSRDLISQRKSSYKNLFCGWFKCTVVIISERIKIVFFLSFFFSFVNECKMRFCLCSQGKSVSWSSLEAVCKSQQRAVISPSLALGDMAVQRLTLQRSDWEVTGHSMKSCLVLLNMYWERCGLPRASQTMIFLCLMVQTSRSWVW